MRECLDELQRYLSDSIAPLMVADAVERLLSYPPLLAAREIETWVAAQDGASRHAVPVSDFLYHAVQKIQQLAELGLVPRDGMDRYLTGLVPLVLTICPVGDREFLAESLRRLGPSGSRVAAAPVTYLHRQTGSSSPLAADSTQSTRLPTGVAAGAPLAASATPQGAGGAPLASNVGEDIRKEVRRFSLLLERLALGAPTADDTKSLPGSAAALRSQLVLAAADNAQSGAELDRLLLRLSQMGIKTGSEDLFRQLAGSLPGWGIAPDALSGTSLAAPTASSAEAMRRILDLTDDPGEVARRLHSLLAAALEQLQEGALPRCVTMLELFTRTVREKRIDAPLWEPIRLKAQAAVDPDRLRRYAEETARHPFLRQVLSFFPVYALGSLLDQLEAEPKRDRRRLLLLLVEVHGTSARTELMDRLAATLSAGDESWHIQRNLIYLLRRIPRAPDAPVDDEIELLALLAEPKRRASLVKEALAGLSQMKAEKAEQRLAARIADVERLLAARAGTSEASDLETYLDRAVSALARMGTPGATQLVVEHALRDKAGPRALLRLAELSSQDLSKEERLVERLVKKLKGSLPVKVLRFYLKKEETGLDALVTALSGTPHPKVRETFEEIARDFAGQSFAALAEKAFATWDKPTDAAGSGSLSGDLAVFGLPELLQSLSGSASSGLLTLKSRRGEEVGRLLIEKGRLRSCQTGRLSGDEAFFQLFERPVPASFVYLRGAPAPAPPGDSPTRAVLPLVLEGMRRYDELQRYRSLVPDDALPRATGTRPTPHPDENDPLFLQGVWAAAAGGKKPSECEAKVSVDAFRVRRLLAHWVEEGSLALQPVRGAPASTTAEEPRVSEGGASSNVEPDAG